MRVRPSTLPLLAAVLLAALCVLALPVLPQLQNVTTVAWPSPGAPVQSTMLTLSPYRPLELHATVPCSPASPPAEGVLFATSPLRGPGAGQGLEVRLAAGRVTVTSEGATLWQGRVPARGCVLRVDAVGDLTRLRVGERVVNELAVDPPRVSALATGLPTGTPGLAAQLLTDSRFETTPTLLKTLTVAASVLAALACLALLAALDPVRRWRPPRWPRSWPWAQDAVLVAVLGFWALAGPMLADDGFNVAVADGFSDTGTVGNRYRWYNAPEVPFALVQQALVPLLELGRSPWLLRLPSVLAAIGTWLLLSRCLLPRLAGGRPRAALWLGLLAFLAWWMPFDLGVRPEPFVALAATGVLVLVLRAVDTGRLLPLALGGVLAALAVACAPSGLLAVAPYVVLAGRLLPLLRRTGLPRPLVLAAVVTPGAVTAAVAVFADTGLAALLEATRIHRVIGPSFDWWEEAERYELLFSESDMGVFARRLPVLLVVGALALLLLTRRRERGGPLDLLTVAAGCVALSFAVLVLTPSKWTHHFGAFAGFAAVLMAGAVLQAGDRLRREQSPVLTGAAALVATVSAAAGFAGPNLWAGYSSFGVAPRLPAPLQSPLLWAVLALVVVGLLARARGGWRSSLPAAPGAVVVLALVTSVALMLGTFAQSSVRLEDSWSMLGENVGHLTGSDCGMADHVEVLRPSALAPAVGVAGGQQVPPGVFRTGGAFLPAPGNLPPGARRWGTFNGGAGRLAEAGTGTLTSQWYAVPDLPRGAELGLAVSGRTTGGNSVVLQYASRSDPGRVLLTQAVVETESSAANWRYVTFGAGGPGRAADLVRVVAVDRTTGQGGWVATTSPLLMRPSLLREVLTPGSVSIDFPISLAFPCAEQVQIAHGLAELPTFSVSARAGEAAGGTLGLEHLERQGGTLVLARETAFLTVLPTRLVGQPPRDILLERGWGTLVRYDYPYPGGLYEVTTRQELRSSLRWGYRFPVPIEPDPLEPLDPFDPLSDVDKG